MELQKKVGIFEAKTHFSQLCDQVSFSGHSLLVERRGKPLVVISPAQPIHREEGDTILSSWERWSQTHPPEDVEFPDVADMRETKERSPFE